MSVENMLLKAEEVAELMGIPKARVYKLSREGEFAGILVKVGERQFRYRRDSLAAYIERGGRQDQSVHVSA